MTVNQRVEGSNPSGVAKRGFNYMDCGVPFFVGEKAKDVYDYLLNLPKVSNKEKRKKRLEEFEKKLSVMKKKRRP